MEYRYDDFQACLNQGFALEQDSLRDELQLIQVDRLDDDVAMEGRDAFSVVFQSKNTQPLPQQIYTLSNARLGDIQLFIVPIAQDESGIRYEAVFS